MSDAADDPSAPRHEGMGGLAKGLAILEAFQGNPPRLTVSEAAQASGTTPAAARRCLLTLVECGYLAHDGKYFRPTPRVMRLVAAYNGVSSLPALAQPCLIAVRDELHQSSSLAVLDGDASLFVQRADSARIVSAGVRVGATLQAHASATGRVLLAALPEGELEQHLARCHPMRTTPNTVVDLEALRARIHQAREEGVAFTDEELELGVRTMAVPVTDSTGHVHAAMSVSAFAAQVSLDVMRDTYLPVLNREAARLGNML